MGTQLRELWSFTCTLKQKQRNESRAEEQGCGVGILLLQVQKGLHSQFYTGACDLGVGVCVRTSRLV